MINLSDSLPSFRQPDRVVHSLNRILNAALQAANPFACVTKHLCRQGNRLRVGGKTFLLYPHSRIVTVAIGKAAYTMAKAANEQLAGLNVGGVAVCKHNPEGVSAIGKIKILLGSHPVPDVRSVRAAEAIRQVVSGLTDDDLVILLVSGGGSALVCLPAEGISLEDIRHVTDGLLKSGASINEMNCVRKHLDLSKGGGLLKLSSPARMGVLVISDVVNSPLDVIASGPAFPDPSTFEEARSILMRYLSTGSLPEGVIAHIDKGCRGAIPETLKAGNLLADRAEHTLIASNEISAKAAREAAVQEGFLADVVTCELTGEARYAGAKLVKDFQGDDPQDHPHVWIAGGETTVKVTGNGLGGRNLEVALGAVIPVAGDPNAIFISLATDGEDGPTDAAGAVVTGETHASALQLGLDPNETLNQNDAYHFFAQVGGLIRCGPTGTNVNDLNFLFRFPGSDQRV